MIGRPDLADDESLYVQRNRERQDVLEAIEQWTARRTVDEVVETGSLYRIPTVPIGNGAIFPRLDHVSARQLFDANPRGGFFHPRSPFRSSITERRPPGPAPTLGEATSQGSDAPGPRWDNSDRDRPFLPEGPPPRGDAHRLPLTGVRVLDFTAFLAGPMCTQYLASLGADVVKVESIQRPDPMRYSVLVDASVDHWYEQGAIYQSANLNKRSVTLNLSDPRGRDLALRLAAGADVVVENFTPRVMDQFGLSFEDLAAVNPRIIMARMPGFGLDGPWSDRPGFAATMEQVSGLAWITGYADHLPMIPGICDPLAGMHSAFAVLTALEHRARTGRGQMVELAMIDLAANLVMEQVLEHTTYGHLMAREGNRQAGLAHQGVYACSGPEQWVALRVGPDEEWRALRSALGRPPWSLDPSLDTSRGRRDLADLLDAELGAWFAGQSQKDALSMLQSAGVERGAGRPCLRRRPRRADERPWLLGGGAPSHRRCQAVPWVAHALRRPDRSVVPETRPPPRPTQRGGPDRSGRDRRGAGAVAVGRGHRLPPGCPLRRRGRAGRHPVGAHHHPWIPRGPTEGRCSRGGRR